MELNYFILTNALEVQKAMDLGMPQPKYQYETRPIVIDLSCLRTARVTHDNKIEIKVDEEFFMLPYEKDKWEIFTKVLNERNKRY